MSDLMRDPKSGRMLSRLETEVKKAAQAAEGFGLTKESQSLLGLEGRVTDDSPAVQDYVRQLVSLVRNFSGPTMELRNILPLIQETMNLASKDLTLTKAQQKRIMSVANELRSLINKKTSLFTRTTRTLKNLSRKGTSRLRDSIVEAGQNSESGLFRLGAKVLSRRGNNDEQSEQKNILQTRADILQTILNRKQQEKTEKSPRVRHVKGGKGRPMTAKEFAAEPEFEEKKSPKKRSTEEDSSDQSALLTHILDTERDVLVELKTLVKTLSHQTQDLSQERDEQARRDELQTEALGKLSPKAVGKTEEAAKTKPTEESGGLFKNLISMLGLSKIGGIVEGFMGALGANGLTGLIIKTLMPSLTTMASGAAVIGAAFAGWEFGKWLDEKAGNKLSDAVGRAAAWLTGGSAQVKVYDDMRAAQMAAAAPKDESAKTTPKSEAAAKPTPSVTPNVPEGPMSAQLNPQSLGRTPNAPTPKTPLDTNALPTASLVTPGATSTSPEKQPYVMEGTLASSPTVKDTTPKQVPVQDISDAGVDFIKEKEHFASKPYMDQTGLAIGYGSHMYKGRTVEDWTKRNPNFSINKDEADAEIRTRLKNEFVPAVRKSLTRPVSQTEFDALVSIAYNRGVPRFTQDKAFLSKVNTGTATSADFKQAHGALQGNVRKGVEQRRADEFALYAGSDSPKLRKASVTNRNASPIAAMSANAKNAPTVVAPTTVIAPQNGSSGASVAYVPVPVRPKNAEATFRAVQTLNEM